MTNLIFPITSDTPENKKFFDETKKRTDVKFLVGVTEDICDKYKKSSTYKNMTVVVFEKGSKKEEIINSLNEYVSKGKILIVRGPILQKEIDKFVASKTDITLCSKKRSNGFVQFFKDLGEKIIKTLFGFTPYEGDVRAVCFGENPSAILRKGFNISYATRVDRWKGYSYSTIDVVEKNIKAEYNVLKVAIMLSVWILLFLGGVAGTVVYFMFLPPTFLSVFVAICGLFLLTTALLIASAMALLKLNAGERYYEKAKEIKKERKK